jgi:hypothetical protein
MKIKSLIFKVHEPELKVVKSLSIYISEKHSEIILAPQSRESKAGYGFEQEKCEVIDLKSSTEIIGEAVKRNFNKYNIAENKSVTGKMADWPALKASKEKTKVGFEKNYVRLYISGINEYNYSLNIETILNYPSGIELTTTITAKSENVDIGNKILKIFNSDICERRK